MYVGDRVTDSNESALSAKTEVKSLMTRQGNFTATQNEYARTESPKPVTVHGKEVRNREEGKDTFGVPRQAFRARNG